MKKNKEKSGESNRFQFNSFLNEKEHETLNILREKYAINISKAFKLFITQYREQLEKSNVNINTINIK